MAVSKKTTKNPNVFQSYGWTTQVSPVVDHRMVDRLFDSLEGKADAVTNDDIEYDKYQIFVSVNVWCLLFSDITGKSPLALRDFVVGNGLQSAVRKSEDHFLYLASVGKNGSRSIFWDSSFDMSEEEFRLTDGMTTLLKFLKRTQLRCVITDQTDAFLETNEKCKNFSVTYPWCEFEEGTTTSDGHPSPYLMQRLRDIFNFIVEGWVQDTSLFRFSPRAVAEEGVKCYMDKFHVAVRNQVWLREHGVNFPVIPCLDLEPPISSSRFSTVPKNMFKGRGVAPEPVSRQILGYQVTSGLYRCLTSAVQRYFTGPGNYRLYTRYARKAKRPVDMVHAAHKIDTKDQSWNRELCKDSFYATLDLKAASDSISYELGRELMLDQPELWEQIRACRSEWVVMKIKDQSGKTRKVKVRNHHLMTMGNACTFNLESTIFLCILLLAYEFNYSFNEDMQHYVEYWLRCAKLAVFGDDIVVAADIAETVVDLLRIFGFEINEDKSYIDSPYRESCGVEYWDGQDVTGRYFPRSLGNQPCAELVALQHRLVEYESASLFLTQCVLDVLPTTIMSMRGSTYDDLWTTYPVEPDLAGSSDYGRFMQNAHVILRRKATGQCKYSIKGQEPETWRFDFSFADTGWHEPGLTDDERIERLSQFQKMCLSSAAVVARELGVASLHQLELVDWCLDGKPWLRTYRTLDQDDYEYHMVIGSRQNRALPKSKEALAELDMCMMLLRLGNGLEHMQQDPYVEIENKIFDSRDLLGDREITWTIRRTLR